MVQMQLFDFLPSEIVLEILTMVASTSYKDLLNAKLSCITFRDISDEDYFYQKISLEKFPLIPWHAAIRTSKLSFFERCRNCCNVEALYRQGLVECLSSQDLDGDRNLFDRVESGTNFLRLATKFEHVGATFLLGIILIVNENESSQQEGKILLDKINLKWKECYEHLRQSLMDIRWNYGANRSLVTRKLNYCQHKRPSGWISETNYESYKICKECGYCDLVNSIYEILH